MTGALESNVEARGDVKGWTRGFKEWQRCAKGQRRGVKRWRTGAKGWWKCIKKAQRVALSMEGVKRRRRGVKGHRKGVNGHVNGWMTKWVEMLRRCCKRWQRGIKGGGEAVNGDLKVFRARCWGVYSLQEGINGWLKIIWSVALVVKGDREALKDNGKALNGDKHP